MYSISTRANAGGNRIIVVDGNRVSAHLCVLATWDTRGRDSLFVCVSIGLQENVRSQTRVGDLAFGRV